MRRSDKEMKEQDAIVQVVEKCQEIHVSMVDGEVPYAVVLNFGYEQDEEDLIFYFHSALEGKKIDVMKKNPNVFLQIYCNGGLIDSPSGDPCSYSWRFESVTGSGVVEFLESVEEKTHALNRIVKQASKLDKTYEFPEKMLKATCVCRVRVANAVGKHCQNPCG